MKLFITGIFIMLTLSVFGQDEMAYPKNEIKTNVLGGIFSIANLNYERIINEESGVGLSLGSILIKDSDANLFLSPYYRLYMGKKPGAGFFVEGSGTLVTYESFENNDGITAGVGFGVGTKLTTKSNWVFEVSLGLTRVFEDSAIFGNDTSGFVLPRVTISFGKRF